MRRRRRGRRRRRRRRRRRKSSLGEPSPRRRVGVGDRDRPPEDLKHVAHADVLGPQRGVVLGPGPREERGGVVASGVFSGGGGLRCLRRQTSCFLLRVAPRERVPPHYQPLLQARVHNPPLDDVGGVVLEVEAELDLADADAVCGGGSRGGSGRRRRRRRRRRKRRSSRSDSNSTFRLQARGAGGDGLRKPPAVPQDHPGVGDVARRRERRGRGNGRRGRRSEFRNCRRFRCSLRLGSPGLFLGLLLRPRFPLPLRRERLDVGAPVGVDERLRLEEGGGLGLSERGKGKKERKRLSLFLDRERDDEREERRSFFFSSLS